MPATFRAFTTANSQDMANGATLVLNKPSGVVAGDLLIVFICQDRDATVKTGIPAPSGWTKVDYSQPGAATQNGVQAVYTRVAQAGDPSSWTWTNTSGGVPDTHATMIAIQDADGTLAAAPTWQYSSANGTAYTAPSVTGVANGLLVCGFFRSDNANATASFTMGSGLTERVDYAVASSWTGLAVGTEALSSAGATGTRTATNTDSARWTTVSLVVGPPAAPNPKTETLVDDFAADNRATKWPDSYGITAVSGGVATVTSQSGTQYSGLQTSTSSANQYTLVESFARVKFTAPSNTAAYTGMMLTPTPAAGTDAKIGWNAGTLSFGLRSGYTYSSPGTLALAAGGTMWLGIGEGVAGAAAFGKTGTAGNLYFYSSPDGNTWTERKSVATPGWAGAVTVLFDNDATSTATSTFDNFNTPLTEAYSGNVALSGAGTLTGTGTPAFPISRALSAGGTLSFARGAMTAAGTRAGTGSGSLVLEGGVTGFCTLAGAGTLTLSGKPGHSGSCGLNGSGSLSLLPTQDFIGSLALTATGTLTLTRVGMSGKSTFAATATGTMGRAVAALYVAAVHQGLSAEGTLNRSSARPAVSGSVDSSADGALTLEAQNAFSGTVSLYGAGSQTRAGSPGPQGNGGGFTTGNLTTSALAGLAGNAAPNGSGTLTAASALMGGEGSTSTEATGSLELTAGTPGPAADLPLTADGALTTADQLVTQDAALPLAAVGALFLSASGGGIGSIALDGSGTLDTTASDPGVTQSRDLSGTGTLSALISGQTVSQTMELTASGSLTGVGTVLSSTELAGEGSLTLTPGTVALAGDVALDGSGDLTGTGRVKSGLELYADGSLALTPGKLKHTGTMGLTGSGQQVRPFRDPRPRQSIGLEGNGTLSRSAAPWTSGKIKRTSRGTLTRQLDAMSVQQLLNLLGSGNHTGLFLPQQDAGELLLAASGELELVWLRGRVTVRLMPSRYHVAIRPVRKPVEL